ATYGIEILQENVVVKPINTKEENSNKLENLTLEAVKGHPEIVAEIERPLVERLDEEIRKHRSKDEKIVELEGKLAKVQVAEFARGVAAKHPKPEEALPILMELAETCKSTEEFSAKAFPILMEALST